MSEIALLGGYEHWLTSDGVRTLVGPVHHRAKRKVGKARRTLNLLYAPITLSRKKRTPAAPRHAAKDETITMNTAPAEAITSVIPRIADTDATTFIPRLTDETITLSATPAAPVTPVVKPTPARLEQLAMPLEPRSYRGRNRRAGMWRHLKDGIMDRAYDSDWHDTVRNVAGTTIVLASSAVALLALGKAALWVLAF